MTDSMFVLRLWIMTMCAWCYVTNTHCFPLVGHIDQISTNHCQYVTVHCIENTVVITTSYSKNYGTRYSYYSEIAKHVPIDEHVPFESGVWVMFNSYICSINNLPLWMINF